MNNRLSAGVIVQRFCDTQTMFERTRLARSLSLFIHDHLRNVRCSEIIALGGDFLGYAANVTFTAGKYKTVFDTFTPGDYGLMCQTQHAAVLFIRHGLEHLQKKTIPIFLSDPNYSEDDAEAGKRLKMTVINGNFGFQQSWTKLSK